MSKREVNYIIQRIQEEILNCNNKEQADEIMRKLFEVSKDDKENNKERKE